MSKKYCKVCDWELDDWEAKHPSLNKKNTKDIKKFIMENK